MSSPLEVEQSRAVPVTVEQGFDLVLGVPLPTIFDRWFALLPAVREVTGQEGEWGTVGQTRTIRLADGGTFREELTEVQRPHAFGYRLTEPTGPFSLLAGSVDGRLRFEPVGTGVRITWGWTVRPASGYVEPLLPVLGWMWTRYAGQALARIEELALAAG